MTTALLARPATQADLPFIAQLFATSYENAELAIGYPRCNDASEILAELALYDAALEDSFHVLRRAHGGEVGTLGFLFSEDMPFAYMAGPLLEQGARDRLEEALAWAESIARGRYPALQVCVADGNHALVAALRRQGWTMHHESLEMVFDLAGLAPSGTVSPWHIERLAAKDAAELAAVAGLLGRMHNWHEPEARLADCLEEGYRVGFIAVSGQASWGTPAEVAGAAAWLHLDNTAFSRLDYVSSHEDWRGRGIATALVRHALADAKAAGDEHMYLALDPANVAAHRVYRRAGFRDSVHSIVYTLELQP